MKKYPKIRRIGDRVNDGILESDPSVVFVQEKLDGANFRFTLERNIEEEYHTEDRDLVFGSRNVAYKNEKDADKSFKHAMEYVRENISIPHAELNDEAFGPLTFFGEAMHPHTIDYEWEDTPSFLGFDVCSEYHGQFLDVEETEDVFEDLGLPTAPQHTLDVVVHGDEFESPTSEYWDGPAEGVVIKNFETEQYAKIRDEKFKEVFEEMRAGGPDPDRDPDEIILADRYATEPRILKTIHKFEDRGIEVGMDTMPDLWREVFEDIIEEEFEEIFLGNYDLNTKDFRSEVAGNTASTLQMYLSRPDDSVLNEVSA